jgi:hypothetical protein
MLHIMYFSQLWQTSFKYFKNNFGLMNAKTILAVSFAAILGISLAVASVAPVAMAANGANKTSFSAEGLALNTVGALDNGATIASVTVKTATPKDLVVMYSEECSLFTEVRLKSNQAGDSVSESQVQASQSIWLTVDGQVVPIGAGDNGKVTMCDRTYNVSTNILDQIQQLCSALNTTLETPIECEESYFNSFIKTKDAHGWNWVVLDLGAGEHTIEVHSEITEETQIGDGTASAAVGKRSLIVLPQNLSNDAAY